MSNIISDEEILCSIKTSKNIKTSSIIANIIVNLITSGVAGRVTNDFKLNLTKDNLYIEAISYSTWGGLSETVYTEKISNADIKSFEVKVENTEQIITIATQNDNKILTFIRDNEKNNNLALQMCTLISQNKKN